MEERKFLRPLQTGGCACAECGEPLEYGGIWQESAVIVGQSSVPDASKMVFWKLMYAMKRRSVAKNHGRK